MSTQGLAAAQEKMRNAGVGQPAIDVFSYYYGRLSSGEKGLIREDDILPLTDPPMLSDAHPDAESAREALSRTVLIKLNGGLGTSMGLDRAKTLLPVREGMTFLDLLVQQVLAARRHYGVPLPLMLMNSFRTREDSLAALAGYPDLPVEGLPLDFLQNSEPKLRADDLTPVVWPSDPSLEWCPPGHGDLYTALESSGVLDLLVERGFRYASVANGDNLGAGPDATIAGWFAATGAPYAAEVCPRTANDRKGGHLAIRKRDGQLILRDSAQTTPEEMHFFTDEFRHPFFHTNNLWLDLVVLRDTLAKRGNVLGLPMIRNEKTVDPSDPGSPKVIQVETAMGAAIEVFEGATAICVGRDRFLPVKTTNELLLVRSDAYQLDDAGRLLSASQQVPRIDLDSHFKLVQDFERRIPHAPSLKQASSLVVRGDVSFGRGVRVVGDAVVDAGDGPMTIPDDAVLGEAPASPGEVPASA